MTQEEDMQLADVICGDFFDYMEKYDANMRDKIYIAAIIIKTVCMTLLQKEGLELSAAKEAFNHILDIIKIK